MPGDVGTQPRYMAALGGRLRGARLSLGQSRSDVEEATGGRVTGTQLDALEQGMTAVTVPVLQLLSSVYRVPIDELVPRDAEALDWRVAPADLSIAASIPDLPPVSSVFVDAATGYRVEAHHPDERRDRWMDYLAGAEDTYRAAAVEAALARAVLEHERPSLFFVAVDGDDRVVGGIRCHGPITSPDEAAVTLELAAHPQIDQLRLLLAERIPSGLVEMKGAWVDRDHQLTGLGRALARCCVHAMDWWGAAHAVACSSRQLARLWQTTGCRTLGDLAPWAYPDERYQTVVLWWEQERLAELSSAAQLERIGAEADQLFSHRVPPPAAVRSTFGAPLDECRPTILDERDARDRATLDRLASDPTIVVLDRLDQQCDSLGRLRPPPPVAIVTEPARWAYFPWRRTLVHILGPEGFRLLRLDRNRNKIDAQEQDRLGRLKIGVVGLSVGHAIAHVLALEGLCGELRLADYDDIELSNLNRLPVTLADLGLNKAVVASRRIAELDPYLPVSIFAEGLTGANIEDFINGLDIVIDECDSLDVKLLLREAARRSEIPVLMETSDRGLFDAERFDLEPERPLFHGLLGGVRASDLAGIPTRDKVPHVLRILEPDQLSSRLAASMAEIDETVTTWPQLGGDVTLGAATMAAAVRRIGTGGFLPSGRVRIDLDALLSSPSHPDERDHRSRLLPAAPGADAAIGPFPGRRLCRQPGAVGGQQPAVEAAAGPAGPGDQHRAGADVEDGRALPRELRGDRGRRPQRPSRRLRARNLRRVLLPARR